mmetsp:Transcript_41930/g.132195  ORF Transcript_41930/g.132195 Transcript_41930/m.132195 type:complete len:241 (-) Transcript_41930:120-842(-)
MVKYLFTLVCWVLFATMSPRCHGLERTRLSLMRSLMSGTGTIYLRGGVSKYYNHTAPSLRGGIFEEPKGGISTDEGQSVWNKGGWSFEERDYTSWCRKRMESLLRDMPCNGVYFSNISRVSGHALVTYRQGKKRAGVNWDDVVLDWQLRDYPDANGSLTIRDFFSDFPEDMEMLVSVRSCGDGRCGSDAHLRDRVLSCVTDFQGLLDKLVEEMMGIKSQRSDASRPHDPSKGEGQEIKAG